MFTGECVQRIHKGFRCRFFSEDGMLSRDIVITDAMVEKFDSIKPGAKVKMKIDKSINKIDSIIYSKYLCDDKEYMIIELEDTYYKISRLLLTKKKPKMMYFLVTVDVRHYNSIHIVEESYTKYLKIFDTKCKAYFYLENFVKEFSNFFSEYLVSNKIETNLLPNFTAVPGILYDHLYIFKNDRIHGNTYYNFNITCIEKG